MKIKFKNDKLGEYQKLLYALYNTENGFFSRSGMHLRYGENESVNTVLLPNYPELKTAKFWKKFSKYRKTIPKNYVSFDGTEFSEVYGEILKESTIEISEISRAWSRKEKAFLFVIDSLFESDNIFIEIFVTKYGAISSYNFLSGTLKIYLRKDADISQIAFCTLSYFIHKYKGKMTWEEQQRIADFLFLNTKLKDIFPNYVSLIDESQDPEKNIKLIQQSEKIYRDFGVSLKGQVKIEADKIFVHNKSLTSLSFQEKTLLKLLLNNKGKITSMDEISNALWGDDYSQFSLQAISKTVERLRQKLYDAGIHKQTIFTKRKQGYVFYD